MTGWLRLTLVEIPFGSLNQIDDETAGAPEPIFEVIGLGRTGLRWANVSLTDNRRLTFSAGLAGLGYLADKPRLGLTAV